MASFSVGIALTLGSLASPPAWMTPAQGWNLPVAPAFQTDSLVRESRVKKDFSLVPLPNEKKSRFVSAGAMAAFTTKVRGDEQRSRRQDAVAWCGGQPMRADRNVTIDGYCVVPINNRDAEQQRQHCAENGGFGFSSDIDPGPGNMVCKKGDGDEAADMNEAACVVVLGGTFIPQTCGQFEFGMTALGGFIGLICMLDPRVPVALDIALTECCPSGTANYDACGAGDQALTICPANDDLPSNRFGGSSMATCYSTDADCTTLGFDFSTDSDRDPFANAESGVGVCSHHGTGVSLGDAECNRMDSGFHRNMMCGEMRMLFGMEPEVLSGYCERLGTTELQGMLNACCMSDAVDVAELCSQTVRPPVSDGFCEDGNSMVATAAFPFDGFCSIPDSMATDCSNLGYSVADMATDGRSICEKGDDDDAIDMNERICAVLLDGEWMPKTCGQWETEVSGYGPAGLAGFCASDPSGGIKGYVDAALTACCPPGTAAEVCGPRAEGLSMCAAGSDFLGSNIWSTIPNGDSETAGECLATRGTCAGAGYRHDDDDPSLVVKCESDDPRMTRTMCDAISGGSFWRVTTCQTAQSHLASYSAHICSNPNYHMMYSAAMMRCCEDGNSISMDSLCGNNQSSPPSAPTNPPNNPPTAPTNPPNNPPTAPPSPPNNPPTAPTNPPNNPPTAPPNPPNNPPTAPTNPPNNPPTAPTNPPNNPPTAPPNPPSTSSNPSSDGSSGGDDDGKGMSDTVVVGIVVGVVLVVAIVAGAVLIVNRPSSRSSTQRNVFQNPVYDSAEQVEDSEI